MSDTHENLVSMQDLSKSLGLKDTIGRSKYSNILEGVTIINFREGRYSKNYVTEADALLIEYRYFKNKRSKLKPQKVKNESYYRDKLAKQLPNSKMEVTNRFGRCDLVTDEYAIEVKMAKRWKSAIGQALAYATALNRLPAVALYDYELLTEEEKADVNVILKSVNIKLIII